MTGVLPIALSRACKLNDYFMHRNKTYVGIMKLHTDVSVKKLKETIKKFVGKIIQLPPIKSRVKRAPREREIKSFEILEKSGRNVLFETEVQAGTYIRKLIHDIGLEIGGAHMLELRRTKAGTFSEDSIINLYDFEKAVEDYKNGNPVLLRKILVPAELALLEVLPEVQINKNINQLLTGKPLMKSDYEGKLPDLFAVFNKEKFIAIMRSVEEGDIIARPEFVFN